MNTANKLTLSILVFAIVSAISNVALAQQPAASAAKTRAQVVAETKEAIRLGLVPRNEAEFLSQKAPTPEQLRLIAEAGERARLATQTAGR